MPTLTVFQPVDGAHHAIDLAADPSSWLPGDSRPAGPGRWSVPLHAAGMSRTVRCELGPPVERRGGTWRTITWEPTSEPGDALPFELVLPTFEGEIGVHRGDGDGVTLVLHGSYEVPLGPVGQAVDAMVLGRVARASVVRLLADIVSAVGQTTLPLTAAGRTRFP